MQYSDDLPRTPNGRRKSAEVGILRSPPLYGSLSAAAAPWDESNGRELKGTFHVNDPLPHLSGIHLETACLGLLNLCPYTHGSSYIPGGSHQSDPITSPPDWYIHEYIYCCGCAATSARSLYIFMDCTTVLNGLEAAQMGGRRLSG